MNVILMKEIKKLGNKGDTVSVAPGFGRNYLIPHGMAVEATTSNIKIKSWENSHVTLRHNKEVREAKILANDIKKLSITIRCEVGENEKLYGSVTVNDIVEAMAHEGVNLNKKQVVLEEPIKTLGIYNIPLNLHPEVEGKVKIWVVKK